ncbi:MAG: hypothetical protein GON13_01285 [Nanoarchaeota archaeon]|nr:hypothetical protein [Nanoarchaeota archaeon]
MKQSLKTGFSFGLTSGIITTLGLMVGLYSSTGSKLVVLSGIITIAFADSLSDALGIHVSEESRKKVSGKHVWTATVSTFVSKFVFAISFILPVILFDLSLAIVLSVVYGLSLLSLLSYYIARTQKKKPWKVIIEHLVIGVCVMFLTNFVGLFVKTIFG